MPKIKFVKPWFWNNKMKPSQIAEDEKRHQADKEHYEERKGIQALRNRLRGRKPSKWDR